MNFLFVLLFSSLILYCTSCSPCIPKPGWRISDIQLKNDDEISSDGENAYSLDVTIENNVEFGPYDVRVACSKTVSMAFPFHQNQNEDFVGKIRDSNATGGFSHYGADEFKSSQAKRQVTLRDDIETTISNSNQTLSVEFDFKNNSFVQHFTMVNNNNKKIHCEKIFINRLTIATDV
jgi:hypothetical protein